MPMSTITVAGISPTLKILGATQQFNYTQETSLFQLTNSFIPTGLIASKLNYELRNNLLSGFRWTHLTESTDTYGSLTLQSFVNAQTFGDDILKFNNSGISIFAPVDFNNNILTNGTWNGNTIDVSYGGTGIATTTPYSVICGGITATGALQSVADLGLSGQILTSQGAGALPIWTAVGTGTVTSITAGTGLTGGTITTSGTISLSVPVSLANGGTNASLTASNGGIFYSTATAGAILAGTSTSNQLLLSGASGAPSWSTVTHPSTTTINQILYSSANNVLSGLATANNGVLITNATGVPSIANTLPATVQGNITSLGTITSGTWNGNTIDVSYGGTGITTTTPYSVICGGITATGALQSVTSLGLSGQVLTSQGAGALPIWVTNDSGSVTSITAGTGLTGGTITTSGTISLSVPVSLANGGTNASLTASNGGIFYSTATAGAILAGTSTSNQLLLSGASGAPSWSTVTHPSTTTINQILYSSANNVLSGLATANNGVLITNATGVPSIANTLPATVQGNITSLGTITSGTWNGNTIDVSYGGTGITTTTPYSVICGGITATGALQSVTSLGLSGQVLTSQGAGALPIWANITSSVAYCNLLISTPANIILTTANTYYKVDGVSTTSLSNLFNTAVSSRMTYTGLNPIAISITASLGFTLSGNTTLITFSIFKNGTINSTFCAPITMSSGATQSISLTCFMSVVTNDFIEVFAACDTNNRTLTVNTMNFVTKQIA